MTMESYFDGRDEEREFRVQRERRKRMRRERQRRIRRQRMKRRILCVGTFVILITFIGLAIKFGRKSRGNETLSKEKKIRLVEQNSKLDMAEPATETDISTIVK